MARTQKNKATNYHLGTLKAKLAKLRNDLLIEQGGGGGGGRKFFTYYLLLLTLLLQIVVMIALGLTIIIYFCR